MAAFAGSGLPGADDRVPQRRLFDASNVVFHRGRVVRYDKSRGAWATEGMEHIDYGLLAFDRSLIESEVAPGEAADLSVLQGRLAARGAMAGFEVDRRYYEIGSPDGRLQLEAFLHSTSP